MYYTNVRTDHQTCVTCNKTLSKGERVLTNNILIVKHPPKKSIKRQYQCSECQDGDFGFVTCGKCGKVIQRQNAFLDLEVDYLCGKCEPIKS